MLPGARWCQTIARKGHCGPQEEGEEGTEATCARNSSAEPLRISQSPMSVLSQATARRDESEVYISLRRAKYLSRAILAVRRLLCRTYRSRSRFPRTG